MSSLDAKEVAKEVAETIRKGEKVNLGRIIRNHGYAKHTALAPQRVTNTKSYKEEIAKTVDNMKRERDAIISLLPKKRSKAHYHQLIDGVDKLTKNIQLLSGGETERIIIIEISEAIAKKRKLNATNTSTD